MTAVFRPVKGPSRSLAFVAAEAVREAIDAGLLVRGDRLPPERELTGQLGVSRTALREAMKMLESMGVVEARVGQGRFVVSSTDEGQSLALVRTWLRAHREEVEHLNEIRTAIEQAAVTGIPGSERRRVAGRLRELVAEAEDAVRRGDTSRAATLDSEFHRTLAGGTRNRPLATLAAGLIDAAGQAAVAVYAVPEAAGSSLRQHARIAAALARGDAGRVQALLEEHFRLSIAVAAESRLTAADPARKG